MSTVEMVASETQNGSKAKKNRGKIGCFGCDRVDRWETVDDHGPYLVYYAEDRETHTYSKRQLERPVAHVLALVENDGNEEEEVSGSLRVYTSVNMILRKSNC